MNKKKIFIIIGIFWVVLIGGFISIKEFTLKTGNEVLLKNAPVDPRDLFRGDYVILRYEISTIDTNKFTIPSSNFNMGDNVYVTLSIDSEKIGNMTNIQKERPKNGSFIRGVVKNIYDNRLTVEYGIESYFVPEGKGREIERNRGKMFTKVAIDDFGNAMIKSLVRDGKEIDIK